MFGRISRRDALKTGATAGAILGLGDLGFLSRLGPVSAAEAKLAPSIVRLKPEIEPLVRSTVALLPFLGLWLRLRLVNAGWDCKRR